MERKDRNNNIDAPKSYKMFFGIFMVIVYLAVGLLFIFDVFNLWNWAVSASVGGVLCAYALVRAYRVYKSSKEEN